MWSAKISGVRDPLEQYHDVVRDHEQLVGPKLKEIRREVEAALGELRRLERRHLTRQRRALAEVRERLRRDARFVLRSVKFAVFAEGLAQASGRLPPALQVALPRDPTTWALEALPLPVAVAGCEAIQEEGYEGEHDCLRDVLGLGLRVGSVSCNLEIERGRRSLTQGFSGVPLVYQHQELAFQLDEHLQKLDLGETPTHRLSCEVAAIALYATPILLEEPAGVSFSYP